MANKIQEEAKYYIHNEQSPKHSKDDSSIQKISSNLPFT